MSNIIREYLSVPSPARVDSPNQVQQWLDSLLSSGISALGSVSDSIRSKLATAILNDMATASGTREGDYLLNARSHVRWNADIRLSALKLLKELSRMPGGSASLGKPEASRILLQQVDFPKQRVRRASMSLSHSKRPSGSRRSQAASSTSSTLGLPNHSLGSIAKTLRRAVKRRGSAQSCRSSSQVKDAPSSDSSSSGEEYDIGRDPDWTITDLALRCLNNALFLNQDARLPFSSDEVGGGHVAVALLSRPEDTPADILFLGARLLFFSTLFQSPFNKTAVAMLNAVKIEAVSVHALLKAILDKKADSNAAGTVLVASGSEAQLNMALSDLLKAHFNICLYYPRIADAEAKQQQHAAEAADRTPSKTESEKARAILGEAFHPELLDMLPPLISVITQLPITSPVPLMPPTTHAIAALLNYPLSHVKKELVKSQPPPSSITTSTGSSLTIAISKTSTDAFRAAPSYISRLITYSDLMLARYFASASTGEEGRRVPEDVDSKSIKQKASADGVDLEDTLEPLLLLVRKIAAEDADLCSTLHSILLPADVDRSLALDRRIDLLGRLIRLMSSVTLPRLARASGELLLSLCEGNAKQMTETIGYGPCAGFLMNTGLASALPSGTTSTSGPDGRAVDPITGEYEPTEEERAMDEINRMTEEEKEAEAERLFVLFDRLNKTGVVQVRHPMEKAREEGRFEQIEKRTEQEERKRVEKEEEEAEREVGREMAERKRRKEEARLRAQRLVGKSPAAAAAAETQAAEGSGKPESAVEKAEDVATTEVPTESTTEAKLSAID